MRSRPGSSSRTTTTRRSWSRPSPTASPRRSPSDCTNACAPSSGDTRRTRHCTATELIAEQYVGIRPAPGYPSQPDHTEKGTLFDLLDAEAQLGVRLTESYAMWPGSSVCGLYIAHPESHYFGIGKIDRDQIADYARRKGWTVAEAERWLAQSLDYDPTAVLAGVGLVDAGLVASGAR